MKFLIVLTCLVAASVATSTDKQLWGDFKDSFGKTYKSGLEEKFRFVIFQDNLRKIETHNARYERGEETYYLKVTQFADMTQEEFVNTLTLLPPTNSSQFVRPGRTNIAAPDSIDWRDRNIFTGVKNQGGCGSCWCFSCTGAIESHYALKYGNVISLSEQQILDCSNGYSNNGCNGGHVETSFNYVRDNGIETEDSYPYEASQGSCRFDSSRKTSVGVTWYAQVDPGEDALKEAVGNIGPVSVLMNADSLSLYGGGVFNNPSCSSDVNHAIIAVGYGNQDGLDYWTIRNSWGAGWGESGHFKLARNANMQCGFGYWSFWPNIA